MDAELREVGIAGDRDPSLHIDGAMSVVTDIVLDRAVPSVTTRRMAPARKAACAAGRISRGAAARGLLSPETQRPSGMRPPAAIAAVTRAILNGEISTGP